MAAASTGPVRFVSKYAGLILQDAEGIWAKFEKGVLETADAAVVKRLRALPESEGVTEGKASAKAGDDGAAAGGDGK